MDFVSPLSPLLFIADVMPGIGCVYLMLFVVRFGLRARSRSDNLAWQRWC